MEIQEKPFRKNRWLGNDTYGYSRTQRKWQHRSNHSPQRNRTETIEPQSVLRTEKKMLGREYMARLDKAYRSPFLPNVLSDRYANAHVFEALSLSASRGPQRFRDGDIPESWRLAPNGRSARLLFPGTILTNCRGEKAILCIRYSFWEEGGSPIWRWGITYLHNYWYPDSQVLIIS